MGQKEQLNIGLIGAGAVGLYYSAHLVRNGHKLTILTRSVHDYHDNIKIDSCNGNYTLKKFKVLQLGQLTEKPFDLLVLATKSLNSINFVELIKPYMDKKTSLLILQNGLFIEDDLLTRYCQPIFRGLAFICVNRLSKTHIHHMDYGALTIGLLNQISDEISINKIISSFDNIGFKFSYVHDIWTAIWEKLIWNASFNPLSVIYGGVSTDKLVNSLEICNRIRQVMQEVCMAAKMYGITLQKNIIELKIDQTKKMTPYKTSMCLDYLAGQPLEIDAILGNLIRFCDNNHINVPNIKKIHNKINSMIKNK